MHNVIMGSVVFDMWVSFPVPGCSMLIVCTNMCVHVPMQSYFS